MSTGAIVAIAVAVVVVLILLALIPRMRRAKAEREMQSRREDRAQRHRQEADSLGSHAEVAELEARQARATAQLHEARADLHDRGLADEELRGDEHAEVDDPVRERSARSAPNGGTESDVPHGSDVAGERDVEGRPARQ